MIKLFLSAGVPPMGLQDPLSKSVHFLFLDGKRLQPMTGWRAAEYIE